MSVPLLISQLVSKLVLQESAAASEVENGSERKSSRRRRKASDTYKQLKWVPFQTLLSIPPKGTAQFDVHRSIREGLAGVELQTGDSRATELATKLAKRCDSVGPAIVFILLALRDSAESSEPLQRPETRWWFSQQALTRNKERIITDARSPHALPNGPDLSSSRSLENEQDAGELQLIRRALKASRKPSCLPDGKPLTGLDKVERLLAECEHILPSHTDSVSVVRATFCYKIETILSDVSGTLHAIRHAKIESLLELERQAKPLLTTCESLKLVLLYVADKERSSPNVMEAYLDSLHELAGQSSQWTETRGYLGKETIAQQIYQDLIRQTALLLTEFFSFGDPYGNSSLPTEVAYENPNCHFVPGVPRPESSRLNLILPAVLGGKSLARRCSYARELGLRYLPNFSVRFGDRMTKHSIEEVCSQIEFQVLMHLTPLLLHAIEHWRQLLLFRHGADTADGDEARLTLETHEELLSRALLDTMDRCMMVLNVVDHAQKACMSEFEIFHLVRSLNDFLLQSIDFDIFPRLLAAIRDARSTEDILDALDQAREDLSNLFFLDDDVRFLTMESLLDAAQKQDLAKFRKCRAFFVKCLRNTSGGLYFLDILDQNGFYRKCAEEFGSVS